MFICIKFLDIETNKKTEVNNMIEIVGRIEGEVKLSDEKSEKSVKVSKKALIAASDSFFVNPDAKETFSNNSFLFIL